MSATYKSTGLGSRLLIFLLVCVGVVSIIAVNFYDPIYSGWSYTTDYLSKQSTLNTILTYFADTFFTFFGMLGFVVPWVFTIIHLIFLFQRTRTGFSWLAWIGFMLCFILFFFGLGILYNLIFSGELAMLYGNFDQGGFTSLLVSYFFPSYAARYLIGIVLVIAGATGAFLSMLTGTIKDYYHYLTGEDLAAIDLSEYQRRTARSEIIAEAKAQQTERMSKGEDYLSIYFLQNESTRNIWDQVRGEYLHLQNLVASYQADPASLSPQQQQTRIILERMLELKAKEYEQIEAAVKDQSLWHTFTLKLKQWFGKKPVQASFNRISLVAVNSSATFDNLSKSETSPLDIEVHDLDLNQGFSKDAVAVDQELDILASNDLAATSLKAQKQTKSQKSKTEKDSTPSTSSSPATVEASVGDTLLTTDLSTPQKTEVKDDLLGDLSLQFDSGVKAPAVEVLDQFAETAQTQPSTVASDITSTKPSSEPSSELSSEQSSATSTVSASETTATATTSTSPTSTPATAANVEAEPKSEPKSEPKAELKSESTAEVKAEHKSEAETATPTSVATATTAITATPTTETSELAQDKSDDSAETVVASQVATESEAIADTQASVADAPAQVASPAPSLFDDIFAVMDGVEPAKAQEATPASTPASPATTLSSTASQVDLRLNVTPEASNSSSSATKVEDDNPIGALFDSDILSQPISPAPKAEAVKPAKAKDKADKVKVEDEDAWLKISSKNLEVDAPAPVVDLSQAAEFERAYNQAMATAEAEEQEKKKAAEQAKAASKAEAKAQAPVSSTTSAQAQDRQEALLNEEYDPELEEFHRVADELTSTIEEVRRKEREEELRSREAIDPDKVDEIQAPEATDRNILLTNVFNSENEMFTAHHPHEKRQIDRSAVKLKNSTLFGSNEEMEAKRKNLAQQLLVAEQQQNAQEQERIRKAQAELALHQEARERQEAVRQQEELRRKEQERRQQLLEQQQRQAEFLRRKQEERQAELARQTASTAEVDQQANLTSASQTVAEAREAELARQEAARQEAERQEAQRQEAERIRAERLQAQQLELQRIQAAKAEAQRQEMLRQQELLRQKQLEEQQAMLTAQRAQQAQQQAELLAQQQAEQPAQQQVDQVAEASPPQASPLQSGDASPAMGQINPFAKAPRAPSSAMQVNAPATPAPVASQNIQTSSIEAQQEQAQVEATRKVAVATSIVGKQGVRKGGRITLNSRGQASLQQKPTPPESDQG